MNPIETVTTQVDKTDLNDTVKLLLKVILAIVVVFGFVIYILYIDLQNERDKCGNSVKSEREKYDNLANAFKDYLIKEIENDKVDKRAWQEAEKQKK